MRRLVVAVDCDDALVIAWHRRLDSGFERVVYEGLDASVPLPEIEAEMALGDLYEGVEISTE